MSETQNDMEFLLQALKEAEKGKGSTLPNPAVGALLVKEGRVISSGYHKKAGTPHAEVHTLQNFSKDELADATLYVTLEPCSHFGKTPPCTDLILKAGVRKVVYGFQDPNPVAAKGESILRNAGIECLFVPSKEISRFYESYAHWISLGEPLVTGKIAMSLDGKIALTRGKPHIITGENLRRFTHEHRLRADAILTSSNTVISDNPYLNARLGEGVKKRVYILDRLLRIPLDSRIFETAAECILIHSNDATLDKRLAFQSKGARLLSVSDVDGGLNLNEVLKRIGEEGVHDLWVEAGGKLFEAMSTLGLFHRAFIYVAPQWLGEGAYSAFTTGIHPIFEKARERHWSSVGAEAILELEW